MSSEQPIDAYAAVLADLEAQKVKVETAIAAIKALQGGGTTITPNGGAIILTSSSATSSGSGTVLTIPVDAFHRLSVSQSIRKFLAMRNRNPATTSELVDALKAGGQSGSEGNNFNVVVNNTLNRMQAPDGGISKVKRGLWGLREWYEQKPAKSAD